MQSVLADQMGLVTVTQSQFCEFRKLPEVDLRPKGPALTVEGTAARERHILHAHAEDPRHVVATVCRDRVVTGVICRPEHCRARLHLDGEIRRQ